MEKSSTTAAGVGSGFVMAAIMSWSKVHLVSWTLLHGAFGWFYVLYHMVKQDY